MRDIIVTSIIFGSLPFILRAPYIGALMWTWLGLMNPDRLCWGFAHSWPFAQLVAITLFISMLRSTDKKIVPWRRETNLLFYFLIWMFITTCFSLNPDSAWQQWDKVWKIILMIFVTLMVMQSRDRINALIWVAALSIGFYGVKGGLFTIRTGGSHLVLGPEETFIGDRGGIALALNMTVPLMRYLYLQAKRAWVKWGLSIAMFLTGFAIIGTHSRGGMLGALCMSSMLIMKSRKKVLLFFFLIITAYTIVNFMPSKWSNRMDTIETYEQDASAMGRINAWHFAYNMAKDNFLGGGFESFRPWLFQRYAPEPDNVHDAHNIFFEILGEHGFIGLTFFVFILGFTWNTASQIIKQGKKSKETEWLSDLAGMIQASLIAYVTGGFFLGLAYFDYYYFMIAVIVLCKKHLELVQAGTYMEIPGQDSYLKIIKTL